MYKNFNNYHMYRDEREKREMYRDFSLHGELGRLLLVCNIAWLLSQKLAIQELKNSFHSKVNNFQKEPEIH